MIILVSITINLLVVVILFVFNYDSTATVDDGSCIPTVVGCMDVTAANYNPLANTSDPSLCIYGIYGCTDLNACNYNSMATIDDGSCINPPSATATITNASSNTNADGSVYISVSGGVSPYSYIWSNSFSLKVSIL